MRYYSGFCFWDERELFGEYLDEGEFCVAGFSYGAQKALIDAVHTHKRVDKLQLISPAFFTFNQKAINLQLKSFQTNKQNYIQTFLTNVIYPTNRDISKYIDECEYEQLEELFSFNWNLIHHLDKRIKLEVFIGEKDKIINVKQAVKFFKSFGEVYVLKDKGHLL
jgi:esterase/lipase